MNALTWFFASAGYGLLSAFVPLFNTEVYLVAAQTFGAAAKVATVIGLAIGQAVGKSVIVIALRRGARLPYLHAKWEKYQARRAAANPGPVRLRLEAWTQKLLSLIGDSRIGPLVVFAGAATAIPPVFVMQFIVPATKLPVWQFGLAMLAGRILFLTLLAFGAGAVLDGLWP